MIQRPVSMRLISAFRTVVFMIIMTLIACLWLPPALLLGLLMPVKERHRFIGRPFCHVFLWLARTVLGIRWEIEWQSALPPEPSVILAKHQSSWETFMLPVLLPPQVQVIKKELVQIPLFGWTLALMNPITLDRSQRTQALKQLVRQGEERLNDGFHVLIFPEGSRIPAGSRKEFSKGGAMLASRLKVPVVPVAHNAGECWPNDSWIRYPGTIHIVVGAPLDTSDLSTKEVHSHSEDWINSTTDRISDTPFNGSVVTELTSGKRF